MSTSKIILSAIFFIFLAGCDCNNYVDPYFYHEHFFNGDTLEGQSELTLDKKGNYALILITENKPPSVTDKNFLVNHSYEFSLKEKILKNVSDSYLGLIYGADKHGYILSWLEVPSDIPRNENLSFSYKISMNQKFIDVHGENGGIGIWKISDK
jgi:hypothetical protein